MQIRGHKKRVEPSIWQIHIIFWTIHYLSPNFAPKNIFLSYLFYMSLRKYTLKFNAKDITLFEIFNKKKNNMIDNAHNVKAKRIPKQTAHTQDEVFHK